jgi:hypothetical protein
MSITTSFDKDARQALATDRPTDGQTDARRPVEQDSRTAVPPAFVIVLATTKGA